MKVFLSAVGLAALLLGLVVFPLCAADAPVRSLPPNCGVLVNDTTFVPLQLVSAWLGATVKYDSTTKMITLTQGKHTAGVKIGALAATVDGKAVQLQAAPFEREGTTYMPVRFIANTFDAIVNWDGSTRQVTVELPGGGKTLTLMVCEEHDGIISGINPKDGAAMVWVPAGPFLMGSPEGVELSNERPQHTVTLDGYWIYRDDVTVDQYRKFCEDTKRVMREAPFYGWQGDNPITNVSWDDAKAYADWAGVALPTEAQWEKAARGTDGSNYPWGGVAMKDDPYNGWDATKCACWENSHDADGHVTGPHAVGSFPSGNSPYGARDMAGNVWQWCADWYDKGYYAATSSSNPTGPATGMDRVLRGGSWGSGPGGVYSLRCASRYDYSPDDWSGFYGFRCVSLSPGP